MDLNQLHDLQTPAGRAALTQAMDLAPDDSTFLTCFNRLSRLHPPELARAALQTALLRRRARAKFSHADSLFFTREALEQASSEPVAHHRARRFAGLSRVADLCCGIGGDALALSAQVEIVAVDLDPLHLAMTGYNLEALHRRDRATLLQGDALTVALPPVEGVFFDPDRRSDGRRLLSIDQYHPPVRALLDRFSPDLPLAVKLAPGVPLDDLRNLPGELEFVSLDGELKECVLWRGPLRSTARRATLLPHGHTLFADSPRPLPPSAEPEGWLYDPDPAISRAGLVGELALLLHAHPIDPGIIYLSCRELHPTPFARAHAIEVVLPFHLQRLRDYLRAHSIGRVQIQRRGSPVDPATLERQLKLRGSEFRILLLTQVLGRHSVLIVRPPGA